jgi:hypothetical protein
MNTEKPFGEVIFSYTRAQAIQDGVLVDLSQFETVRRAWKFPFACTAAVWSILEAATVSGEHDLDGILHDITVIAQIGIKRGPSADILRIDLTIGAKREQLKLHIGPGDTPEPVITLMLENED